MDVVSESDAVFGQSPEHQSGLVSNARYLAVFAVYAIEQYSVEQFVYIYVFFVYLIFHGRRRSLYFGYELERIIDILAYGFVLFLDLSFLLFVFTRIVVVSVIEYAKLCIAIKGKAHVRIGFLGNLALEQFVQSVVVVVGEYGKLVGKCHLDDIHYHVIGVVSVIILIVLF